MRVKDSNQLLNNAKNNDKRLFFILIFFILVLIISLTGYLIINNNQSEEKKSKELELKEKEIALKEKEMQNLRDRENELKQKKKELNSNENQNYNSSDVYINLNGTFTGSIKNGTYWRVTISGFEGNYFEGYNVIYWQKYPNGYRTAFTGNFNKETREITMFEDRNAKGAGKFIGKISTDGTTMSGVWYRYSDNGSFTWNLSR